MKIKSELKGIFFISILAYHLLHSIEYTLNQQGIISSGKTIKRLMNIHTYSIIPVPTVNKTTITIRKPGTLEGIHDHIYRKLVVNSILKTSAKIATLEKLL